MQVITKIFGVSLLTDCWHVSRCEDPTAELDMCTPKIYFYSEALQQAMLDFGVASSEARKTKSHLVEYVYSICSLSLIALEISQIPLNHFKSLNLKQGLVIIR